MNQPLICVTWIGKNKICRRDFNKQLENGRDKGKMYWDDTRYNRLKVGDYFGFVDSQEDQLKLKIYPITKIIGKEGRDEDWRDNGYIQGSQYDTSKRNSIEMKAKPIREVDWLEYVNEVGYKRPHLQCTQYIKNSSFFEGL